MAAPDRSEAALGDLAFQECHSEIPGDGDGVSVLHGCELVPSGPGIGDASSIQGAARVLEFEDTVYVSSLTKAAITWFDRGPDGSLTFAGCIAEDGDSECLDAATDSMKGAHGMAVSADGETLYLAATGNGEVAGAVNWFERDADGDLTFDGCLSDNGEHGCENSPRDTMTGSWDIVVAGEDVYVASTSSYLTRLSRDADGSLTVEGCFADARYVGGAAGCADPGGATEDPIQLATGVALSPDGESLYLTSTNSTLIAVFDRSTGSGALTYLECHANGGSGGCEDPPKDVLGGLQQAVVSGDGLNVYVTGFTSYAVSAFTRHPDGSLDFLNCVANNADDGCVDSPVDAFQRVLGIAIDPAGRSVYASTEPNVDPQDNGAVITLSRGAGGALGFQGCVANDGFYGCADPPMDSLAGAYDVEVSTDGQSAYVASYWGKAVTAFELEAVPLAPVIVDTDPDSGANYNEPAIKGSAQAGARVRIYATANCTGPIAAAGSAGQFSGSGLTVVVLDNTTTTYSATATDAEGPSPCSNSITYVEESLVPGTTPAPTLTATNPPSPADDNTPLILGGAEAGTTVHIHASADCSGPVVATGSAAQLATPGIEVSVGDSTTTTFSATATGVGGTSPCSSSLTYTEMTLLGDAINKAASRVSVAVLLGKKARVRGRRAHLRLFCRGAAGTRCAGAVRIRARLRSARGKRRTRTIGRGPYSLMAGRKRRVKVRLSKRGAALARRAGRRGLRVRVVGRGLRSRSIRLRSAR